MTSDCPQAGSLGVHAPDALTDCCVHCGADCADIEPSTIWLVTDNSEAGHFKPFAERYRVFTDSYKAAAWAASLGWEDPMGLLDQLAMGSVSLFMCGTVDVSIGHFEVQQ